jgi:hypothetical protein
MGRVVVETGRRRGYDRNRVAADLGREGSLHAPEHAP